MPKFTVELTEEEAKALEVDMVSIQEWLDNAIHNKARQMIDLIVQQHSHFQPDKITREEKLKVVREAKVKSAKEREEERIREEE